MIDKSGKQKMSTTEQKINKNKLSITEQKIINSYWFQRLKYVHPTTGLLDKGQSYYDFSLSLFNLTCKFYENNKLLRATALASHLGKIPFNDINIKQYDSNYKNEKLKYILFKTEISDLLRDDAFPPRAVYDIITGQYKNPITSHNNILGLQSISEILGAKELKGIITKIKPTDKGIETDYKTALNIHKKIIKFNRKNINNLPRILILHDLLTKIKINDYYKKTELEVIKTIIQTTEKNKNVKELFYNLLFNNEYTAEYDISNDINNINNKKKQTKDKKTNAKETKKKKENYYNFNNIKDYTVLVKGKALTEIDQLEQEQIRTLKMYEGRYHLIKKETNKELKN